MKGTAIMKKGLIIVHTGEGKGKTTAALGLTLRAAGHGIKVCFIQFIKGGWNTGEKITFSHLNGSIDFFPLGDGCIYKSRNMAKDLEMAQEAWAFAQEMIHVGEYGMVVLDELTWLFHYHVVTEIEVLSVLDEKPKDLHVVITGRNAPKGIIESADLVTEMANVKHPLRQQGIKAQKGIEF